MTISGNHRGYVRVCLFISATFFTWCPGAMFTAAALGQAPAPGTEELHIEVTFEPGAQASPPAIRPRQLVLSQGKQQFILHAAKPAQRPEVHLLLLKEAEQVNQAYTASSAVLKRAFAQGWLVSMAGSDGQTPYLASESALNGASANVSQKLQGATSALEELASFEGRRLAIVSGAPNGQELETAARHGLAEMYFVDGGVTVTHVLPPGGPCLPTEAPRVTQEQIIEGPPSCGSSNTLSRQESEPRITDQTRENAWRSGVWHGSSLGAALSEAVQGSDRYFDLQTEVPTAFIGSTLELLLRGLPGGIHFEVSVYLDRAGLRDTSTQLIVHQN